MAAWRIEWKGNGEFECAERLRARASLNGSQCGVLAVLRVGEFGQAQERGFQMDAGDALEQKLKSERARDALREGFCDTLCGKEATIRQRGLASADAFLDERSGTRMLCEGEPFGDVRKREGELEALQQCLLCEGWREFCGEGDDLSWMRFEFGECLLENALCGVGCEGSDKSRNPRGFGDDRGRKLVCKGKLLLGGKAAHP